jgi:hypothetical protein
MPSAGFETAIPATKGPQNYVLDRTATGIGLTYITSSLIISLSLPKNFPSAFSFPNVLIVYVKHLQELG